VAVSYPALDSLEAQGIYFAPLRHHSPACAWAVRAMLRELRPAAVLVEGPDSFNPLLPLLLDEACQPPLAVLCQADAGGDTPASAFFPFCDYSPEWVGLRTGHALGAALSFIDLPWSDKAQLRGRGEDADHSLMAERYFQHSRYVDALAARVGCRDHNELWDHLFELRPPAALADWRTLLRDVYHYCAETRADYETEVLEGEGSLPRERHMAAHVRHWRKLVQGNIVVLTGGFHTPGLLELCGRGDAAAPRSAPARDWLIRYSFDQLDALNGYGAGMPAPAYFQRVWEALQAGEQEPQRSVALDCLTGIAQQYSGLGLVERIGTADVQAAALQAMRLAELRGHPGPGRHDLMDAMQSCFIKGALGESAQGLPDILRRYLGGSRLGQVPASAGAPPLLEDGRRLARQCRIRLDDAQLRTVRLEIHRKPAHRLRSRFLHLMRYLDCGLGRQLAGPDYLAGTRLDLMVEEWEVAWTPLVEARLVELAAQGATLQEVALRRLREQEAALGAAGQAQSAGRAVSLLVQSAAIGLHERLPALLDLVAAHLAADASFASVVQCARQLQTLWRARAPLGMQGQPGLQQLMQSCWPAALFLLPALAGCKEEEEAAMVDAMLALREFGRGECAAGEAAGADAHADIGDGALQQLHGILAGMGVRKGCAPGIAGAATAILYLDAAWDQHQLAQAAAQRFGPGAQPDDAVRFLSGLMAAAPELLVTQPALLDALDRIIEGWDERDFMRCLPELRRAFSALKPVETSEVARLLAHGLGVDASELQAASAVLSEADMLAGAELQSLLREGLARDGLHGWLGAKESA
jgi:hypothetical protein